MLVIRAGFEPELIAPKTIVLPLHHRAIWADDRNRTYVSNLEGWSNNHYTTSANGAEDQARTGHPDLGKVVLYQMSYFREWTHLESNQAPNDYESFALTEWAIGPKSFILTIFEIIVYLNDK